jgi:hypothetical protein
MTLLTNEEVSRCPTLRCLLDAVQRNDFATGYRGLRIAKSGRRFWIEDVTMWNLVNGAGVRVGQAAAFYRWSEASRGPRDVGSANC